LKKRTDMAKLPEADKAWLAEHGIPEGRYAQPPNDAWDYFRMAILIFKGKSPKEAFDEVWGAEELPF